MGKLATGTVALITFLALSYLIYVQYPRTTIVGYQVSKMVPENRIKIQKATVEVDGKIVEVEVPVEYTEFKPVWEDRTRQNLPTLTEWAKFIVFVSLASFLWMYMLTVLCLWARYSVAQERESERIRDVRKRLDTMISLAIGVVMGFVGGHYLVSTSSPSE